MFALTLSDTSSPASAPIMLLPMGPIQSWALVISLFSLIIMGTYLAATRSGVVASAAVASPSVVLRSQKPASPSRKQATPSRRPVLTLCPEPLNYSAEIFDQTNPYGNLLDAPEHVVHSDDSNDARYLEVWKDVLH